jgi:hypothetical protein
VFPDASLQIASDSDVEDAIWPVREDINPRFAHSGMLRHYPRSDNALVDGRDKPGHDGFWR